MKKTTKKKMQVGGMYGAAPTAKPVLDASQQQALDRRKRVQEYNSEYDRYQKMGMTDKADIRNQLKKQGMTRETGYESMYRQKGGKIKGGGGARAGSVPGMGMTKIKKKLAGVRASVRPKRQLGGVAQKLVKKITPAKKYMNNKELGEIYKSVKDDIMNLIGSKGKGKVVPKRVKQQGGKVGDYDMIQKYKDMTKKPISPGRGGYIPGKPAKGNGIKNFDKAKNVREQYERMVNRPAKGPKTPKRYK